jgi:hypothetical protein
VTARSAHTQWAYSCYTSDLEERAELVMLDAKSSIVVLDQPFATSAAQTQTLSIEGVLDALKMILIGAPLNDVLHSVALLIEAHSEGILCTIYLLDEVGELPIDTQVALLRVLSGTRI